MGSALLNTTIPGPALRATPPSLRASVCASPDLSSDSADALKLEVAQRLAAHRNRRGRQRPQTEAFLSDSGPAPDTRASRIADAVAKRYAQSPSYRAYLAAEAERAIQEAQATAEIAALNARAVAQAQQQLLDSLEASLVDSSHNSEPAATSQIDTQLSSSFALDSDRDLASASSRLQIEEASAPSLFPDLEAPAIAHAEARASVARSSTSKPRAANATHSHASAAQPSSAFSLTVRLDDSVPGSIPLASFTSPLRASLPASPNRRQDPVSEAEARALDEEIAFRQAPVFEEPAGPPMPLPANLIEFPRQLVAPRKARPRCAEGPLREEEVLPPTGSQLRIFEVDPADISTTPESIEAAKATAAQWTSLWLDAPQAAAATSAPANSRSPTVRPWEAAHPSHTAEAAHPRPQAAAIPRRLQAAAIDGGIVLVAFAAFAATFIALVGRTALAPSAAIATSALSIPALYLLYQLLFFTFSEATPGMRIARIALCTFDDDNPTRSAMRRRILAVMLSTFPLGMGFLWAALDKDRLAWHDLISRMYQRSY